MTNGRKADFDGDSVSSTWNHLALALCSKVEQAATTRSPDAPTVRALLVRYRMLLLIYGVVTILGTCELVRRRYAPAPLADSASLPPEAEAQMTLWPNLAESHYLRSIEARSLRFDLEESRDHLMRALEQAPKADERLLYDLAWVLARMQADESEINAAIENWRRNFPNSKEADPRDDAQLPYPVPDRAAAHWFRALSHDGAVYGWAPGDGTLKMWMVDTGNGVTIPTDERSAVRYLLGFTSDRSFLAAVRDDPIVQLYDVETGEPASRLVGHTAQVYSLTDSFENGLLATGGADRTVRLWDATDGSEIRTLKGFERPVSALAFSPDGSTIAAGMWSGGIRISSIETDLVIDLDGHDGAVSSLAYSPDGRLLASASRDRSIVLWDMETRKKRATFTGHDGPVCSIKFSADGQVLLSGSADRTSRIWYVADGSPAQTMTRDSGVFFATFAPGERSVVVACVDGTAKSFPR